jgi:hypothetical protein
MPQFANVLDIHPDSVSVDVELHNGRKCYGVTVLSLSASRNSGQVDLPSMDDKNEVLAIVDFFDGEIPFVTGFMFPQINRCSFKENRAVNRHHSGFYSTIDATGNAETYHPSGAYVRIAESTEHEDLTRTDVDEKWTDDKNADKDVKITIGFKGNEAHLILAKDGTIKIKGDVSVLGDVDITGKLRVSDETTLDNKLTVADDVLSGGNIKADGDVTAGVTSLQQHIHGNGNNGAPTTPPLL